jgi:chorismate dehydratase
LPEDKLTVCAVSFLNTAPLVWGMLHGPQRGLFHLEFRVPAECAAMMERGEADIGLVPLIETARHGWNRIRGVGIACHGTVRSILLISKCLPEDIHTLAADSNSRTSVELARIILERRYGSRPEIFAHPPGLDRMLDAADAALLIGDSALMVDPAHLPYRTWDLGEEWYRMTGLPMVFAMWAACAQPTEETGRILRDSCRFGLDHIDDIVREESRRRSMPEETVRHYLTRQIVHEFGTADYEGLNLFLQLAGNYSKVR